MFRPLYCYDVYIKFRKNINPKRIDPYFIWDCKFGKIIHMGTLFSCLQDAYDDRDAKEKAFMFFQDCTATNMRRGLFKITVKRIGKNISDEEDCPDEYDC